MLLLTGCGGPDPASIDVGASLSVCQQEVCRSLPAAGADVLIRRDGQEVVRGTLDGAGHFVHDVEAGSYSVQVAYPDLDLEVRWEDPVVVTDGEGFSLSLYFPETFTVDAAT